MADESLQPSNSSLYASTSLECSLRGSGENFTAFPPYKPNRSSGVSLTRFRRPSPVDRGIGLNTTKSQTTEKLEVTSVQPEFDSTSTHRRARLKVPKETNGKAKLYQQRSVLVSASNKGAVKSKNIQTASLKEKNKHEVVAEGPHASQKSDSQSHHVFSRERMRGTRSRDGQLEQKKAGQIRNWKGKSRERGVNKVQLWKRLQNMEQDTDFDLKKYKSYWVPDKNCTQCSNCGLKFTTLLRRHHCRICGHIFCNTCSLFSIPVEYLQPGLEGNMRTCQYCLKVFQDFRKSKRMKKSSQIDFGLSIKRTQSSLHPSFRFEEDSFQPLQGRHTLDPMTVQFSDENSSGGEDSNVIDMSQSGTTTADDGLAVDVEQLSTSDLHTSSSNIPSWKKQLHQQDLTDLSSSSSAVVEPRVPASNDESFDFDNEPQPKEEDMTFSSMYNDHFDALLTQIVKSYGLSLSWLDILRPLINKTIQEVQTYSNVVDVMNLNEYIRVKKVPCGEKRDSSFINGVVCTKDVTHKRMKREISNHPTILLLNCPISFYDPSSMYYHDDHLTSLDNLSLQESKYLQQLVNRIKSLNPSVILVQKYVSRLALEKLFHLGVVVAVNVKQDVMNRVARCTGAKILCSLNDLLLNVQMGRCRKFYMRDFLFRSGLKKTLMYFDGCQPHLGCTVMLQGGTSRELKKVKKVAKFGLRVAFNSILELAFLEDESAWPGKVEEDELEKCGWSDEPYQSSSSTPEVPLYPSLANPLESHHLSDVAERLSSLEICSSCEVRDEEENVSARQQDGLTHSAEEAEEASSHVTSQQLVHEKSGGVSDDKLESTRVNADSSSDIKCSGETLKTATPHLHPQENEKRFESSKITTTADTHALAKLGETEFKKAMERQLISMSPQVKFNVPYLQTSEGLQAHIRRYLSRVIYWSVQFAPKQQQKVSQTQTATSKEDFNQKEDEDIGLLKTYHAQNKTRLEFDSEMVEAYSHLPSYKSVAEHPFTRSFLLLRANTSEMQAALADFRSRAGVKGEDNLFLFESAKLATNHQLLLQNVFSKYKQFDMEQRDEEMEDIEDKKEIQRHRKKKKRKKRWWIRGVSHDSERKNSETQSDSNQLEGSPSGEEVNAVMMEDEDEGFQTEVSTYDYLEHPLGLSKSSSDDDLESKSVPDGLEDVNADCSSPKESDEDDRKNMSLDDSNKLYKAGVCFDQIKDCLDPRHHQGISILFGNTLRSGQLKPLPCVPLFNMAMLYYGHNDMSLGEFLQRYCFNRANENCSSCDLDMTEHFLHIVHGRWSINIEMRNVPIKDKNVHTWLECLKCHKVTPKKLMSSKSLKYSFAKFLELKLYVDSYTASSHGDNLEHACLHRLHQDYSQFFMCRNRLAIFRPSIIDILEIMLPPTQVVIRTSSSKYQVDYSKECEYIERIIEGVFYRIEQKLDKYRFEPIANMIDDHVSNSRGERDALRSKLNILKDLMVKEGLVGTSGKKGMASSLMGVSTGEDNMASIQDFLAQLKRLIVELVECWNIKLEELDGFVKNQRKKKKISVVTKKIATVVESDSQFLRKTPVSTAPATSQASESTPINLVAATSQAGTSSETMPTSNPSSFSLLFDTDDSSSEEQTNFPDEGEEFGDTMSPRLSPASSPTTDMFLTKEHVSSSQTEEPEDLEIEEEDQETEKGENDDMDDQDLKEDDQHSDEDIPDSFPNQQSVMPGSDPRSTYPSSGLLSKDSSTTNFLSKFRTKEQKLRDSPNKYYLLASQNDAGGQLTSNSSGSSSRPGRSGISKLVSSKSRSDLFGGGAQIKEFIRKKSAVTTSDPITIEATGKMKMTSMTGKERLSRLSRPFRRLPPPQELNEHHTMPSYSNFPISIYEKEPTSIIAYALSLHHYNKEKNQKKKRQKKLSTAAAAVFYVELPNTRTSKGDRSAESTDSISGSVPTGDKEDFFTQSEDISLSDIDPDVLSTTASSGLSPISDHADDSGLKSGDIDEMDVATTSEEHVDLEFSNPDKTATFSCKVYFADCFHQFRERFFPAGEDRFIHSLCRCVAFDAKGGKSRAAFCKVADDRFILKQVLSVEISAFLEFAPKYLNYISKALEENRPTALAKIFGAYSISFKNNKTNKSKKMDVIIMENLLYECSSSRMFDLKGSMRNRYVDPDKNNSGDVLLDENFLKYISRNPVYMRPHSKFVLMKAISADSEFLAQNFIMDYSLLTCIDESSGTLIVGIIDYVRPFTLDKRLEMYVKKTARKELPTVVNPGLYRTRFCEAMERYFTMVPDKWSGLGTDF